MGMKESWTDGLCVKTANNFAAAKSAEEMQQLLTAKLRSEGCVIKMKENRYHLSNELKERIKKKKVKSRMKKMKRMRDW